MHRFYFRFQWLSAFLLPFALITIPGLIGIETDWSFPAQPYIVAGLLFILLLSIAIITTSTAKIRRIKGLTSRITFLLESSYMALLAILLTEGKAPDSNSMVMSVLLDRGIEPAQAWLINDTARACLYAVMFLFLSTALISAVVERISFKHRSIETFDLDDIDPNR